MRLGETTLALLVSAASSRLMALLDAGLPGQLQALYLVGSVALADYREGVSDIDFVAVLAEPQDLTVLSNIHADLAATFPGLHCDGIYLRPGDLSTAPGGAGPSAREGRVCHSADERHPVTWWILAEHGVVLRGPAREGHGIAADRAAIIRHSRANLDSYWRKWLQTRRRLVSPVGPTLLTDDATTWGCLGIARLHATIATGRVPSKTGAGQYAAVVFPDHGRIVAESLRLRSFPETSSLYRSRFSRRRELIAFMDTVLAG